MNDRDQSGFSLIELLMAMAVTLVISGSIVGLLAVGQTAFMTQPEQTERQQNLRIALNAIAEDVMQAGSGLPRNVDVFEAGHDQVGSMGAHGELTDELWLFRATDCAAVRVCLVDGAADVFTREPIAEHGCFNLPNLVFIVGGAATPTREPTMATRFATWSDASGPSLSQCISGSSENGHLTFTMANGATINTAAPFSPFAVGGIYGSAGNSEFETQTGYIVGAQRVAYRIVVDPNPADEILIPPSLERGQMLKDQTMFWEPIARGIDDLQIEYLQGDPYDAANTGVFAAEPVPVRPIRPSPPYNDEEVDPTSLVRQVRVRLSARTVAEGVQGGTISQQMEIVLNPTTANASVSANNNES